MADPRVYLTPNADNRLRRMLDWFETVIGGGRGGFPIRGGFERPEFRIYRVKTNGSHAPAVTQAGILCDDTWTAITGETPDLTNESLVTIPDATKCYAVPGGDESLLIIQAFICADAP
jgi:hypothetical protein